MRSQARATERPEQPQRPARARRPIGAAAAIDTASATAAGAIRRRPPTSWRRHRWPRTGRTRRRCPAAHHINLDAGFVQGAQHTRVIRAARAVAAQKNGGSQVWGIAHASSWIVTSLTISKLRTPFGVVTLISSPSFLPTMARPIGELVEMSPFAASASSGMTS